MFSPYHGAREGVSVMLCLVCKFRRNRAKRRCDRTISLILGHFVGYFDHFGGVLVFVECFGEGVFWECWWLGVYFGMYVCVL